MFTGIVTDVGKIHAIDCSSDGVRLSIATAYDVDSIELGASVACAGVCLTVVETSAGVFSVDASNETLARTTLGGWRIGTGVNLERALKVGDELGGHLVSGHVDGVGAVAAVEQDGASFRYVFQAPTQLTKFVAEKGSIAIDGVSLTVNGTSGDRFEVNIIPFTRNQTTFGSLQPGAQVNIEVDMLARYVARLMEGS